jgi:hypothetical protein
MSNPAIKNRVKFWSLAVLIVLVTVIALTTLVFSDHKSRFAHLPDGRVIKFERYAFEQGTVRYELPNRPWVRGFAKVLPEWAKRKVTWLRPQFICVVTPRLSNEPLLSAAFSLRDSSGRLNQVGTRLAVADDRGQVFDSVVNYLGNQGVFEVEAFPRRGKEVRLRLMEGDKRLAEFRIPNPCLGPHTSWKKQDPTLVVTNAPLEITLENFTADAVRLRTQCMFRIRENGRESTSWLPVSFEVLDATGNHWRPGVDSALQGLHGNLVSGGFFGALWPEEDDWKLRVEFNSVDTESKSEPRTVEFLAKPVQVGAGRRSQEPGARIKAED